MTLEELEEMMGDILESLRAKMGIEPQEPAKPKRWRAEEDGTYLFVDNDGVIENTIDERYDMGDRQYLGGNYFRTEEEAKASTLYHILNSDYFYWFPDCPKPEEIPEGCECCIGGKWETEDEDTDGWGGIARRWPKNMEKGK